MNQLEICQINFQFNGSQPNKCIHAITGGKYGYNWTGAILVMIIKDVDVENFGMGPHTYIDMEMNDLKDVRDWLLGMAVLIRIDLLRRETRNIKPYIYEHFMIKQKKKLINC